MDYHDQGEVEGFSPAYASSQSHFSDTKVHEKHSASQLPGTWVGKKVSFSLAVHPEPDDGLPDYSGRTKGVAIRHAYTHTKTSSTIPQKFSRQLLAKSKIRFRDVPTKLLLIPREPTAGHPYLFHARIKLDEALQDELESGFYDPRKRFLTQPIATGVWYGANLKVVALKGHKRQYHTFHNKVTWGEFLTELFTKHPTGSWRNLRPGEKDFFPQEDWEFYEVQVSLWMGAPVV